MVCSTSIFESVNFNTLKSVLTPLLAQALLVARLRRRGRGASSRGAAAVAGLAGDVSSLARGLVRGCGSLVWHTVRAPTRGGT
jgi:hypothetical protein